MTTINTPSEPATPGFRADEWLDDVPLPYRILFGEIRAIDGLDVDLVCVQATAIQYSDGRIDDGSVHEPPHVYLRDDALSTAQARDLAAALLEVADALDRLASNSGRSPIPPSTTSPSSAPRWHANRYAKSWKRSNRTT
jgi:hypothetical protein